MGALRGRGLFGTDSLDSWRGAYLIFSLSIRRLRSVRRRFLSRLAHFLLAWRWNISTAVASDHVLSPVNVSPAPAQSIDW